MTDGAQPDGSASGSTAAQLAPGDRLGPYEIESVLGTGGQGPVFRGRDTRDGRAVAIKTSREPIGDGFARAAHAMAALHHPHICQIYEAGPTYLAMELVEGETLAARIERGAFAIGPVLQYGAQMAGALAEAHSKGITHGNLTPGKIMITKAGVKILGFGLGDAVTGPPANLAEPRGGPSSDARTDIYALGRVLYEMATGRRAAEQPMLDGLPEKFGHVVERCLAKEPGSRWQSAADVKAELEWAGRSASLPALASRQPQRALWAWGLAAIVISTLVLETRFRQPPAAPPEMRLEMITPATSDPVSLAVSPDGLQVVFRPRTPAGRGCGCGRWDRAWRSRWQAPTTAGSRSGRETAGRWDFSPMAS